MKLTRKAIQVFTRRAGDPVTSAKELAVLVDSPYRSIRRAVAKNPNADLKTLVRAAVKQPCLVWRNPTFQLAVLADPTMTFLKDSNVVQLSKNPAAPPELRMAAAAVVQKVKEETAETMRQYVNSMVNDMTQTMRGTSMTRKVLIVTPIGKP